MERSVKSYAQDGKGFTQSFQDYCIGDFAVIVQFWRNWFRSGHFIPEPRNFAEVNKLAENVRKPWLKATLKEIKNLINNMTFIIEDPKHDEPVTPCMDVYKAKIQSDGSLDKLKLRIVVRGDLQNKEMIGGPQGSFRKGSLG